MPDPLPTLTFLFAAGLLSGWIDSIAGGGGLITIPALFAVGLPPLPTLATNKIAATFGSLTASVRYTLAGYVLPVAWPMAAVALLASVAGATLASHLPAHTLDFIITAALLVVAAIVTFRKNFGSQAHPWQGTQRQYLARALTAGAAIGFYDGLIGPGTGTFLAFAFVLLLGADFRMATGSTKIINFATNFGAAVYFAFSGHVVWLYALTMGPGILLGAYIGSGMTVKAGPKLIKPIFVLVALALVARLLHRHFTPQ